MTPLWAIITGAVIGAASFGLFARDVWETDGWPTETAELVSAPDSAPPWDNGCGKGSDPRDFTWRSTDPPVGMPPTFRQLEECNVTVDPGDRATIVRVVESDGRVRVFINPVPSYWDAAGMAAVCAFFWFAGVALIAWLRRIWLRRTRKAQSAE